MNQQQWEELWDYLHQHDGVHLFGSKNMGWVRISWPGGSKFLAKSTTSFEEANKYLTHALRQTALAERRIEVKREGVMKN